MDSPIRKKCTKCDAELPLDDFHKDASRADGFAKWCKECVSREARRRYQENHEEILAKQRLRRTENADHVRAIQRESDERRREYRNTYNKARYREKREEILVKSRWAHLARKFGVTPESFADMLDKQGGSCAICRTKEAEWHVDHDHGCCPGARTCGNCVRGILCRRCNIGLGNFRDDPGLLEVAISYLRAQ